MGIIIKQSIKGSIWSYAGTIIGFITTSVLYPNYLTTDVVGLFGLLVAYSTLFSQFSLLGLQGVTSKLFPVYRDSKTHHHGFLALSLLVSAIGFSLFLIVYYFLSPYLIESNQAKSMLFAHYIWLLIPLTFFSMVYSFLDTYNKLLYNAVLGIFLQDFVQRIIILLLLLLFVFKFISIDQLILLYAFAVCIKGLIILIYLITKKEISFHPDKDFFTPPRRKEFIDVALFSILGSLGFILVFNLDKILINQLLDLSNTGIYTIAFSFGTLVNIPSRPLLKISGTLIADAWAKNDIPTIKKIYAKSCLNQFIIGGFLFCGLWSNIDNVLRILGPDYQSSKWVIFFIGIGYLFDMLTGANNMVINFSKYYRISLLFVGILILLVVSLIYLLVPIWGITGAAIAICGALFINNLMRYLFLVWKFKMQPFSYKFIIILLFYIGCMGFLHLIPQFPLIPDILLRGIILSLACLLFYYNIPISEDVKGILIQVRKKLPF